MTKPSRDLSYPLLLLCGGIGGLAALVLALGSMYNPGAFFCLCICLVLWVGAGFLLRPLFQKQTRLLCAVFGLFMALCLRLCLFDYISPDYVSFLSVWTETIRNMTVREALITPIGDYNMPYLYLLLMISRLPVYDLYCIKLISVIADVFLALGAAYLAKQLLRRESLVLAVFLGTLLAPTLFLNSSYWGQCDGVYGCFAIWGLYFGVKQRGVPAMGMLALSFAFKLQAIFILPVVLFLLVKGHMDLKHLVVFPVTFLVVMLPALLAGRSFSDTFSIYLNQTSAYPYLSLNAPTFWSLIPNEYFSRLGGTPVVLAGILVLLLLYVFLPRAGRLTSGDLVDMSLMFCLAIPWLLPRMHERYFFLAEVLSILYVARHPKRLPVAVIQLGGGFLIYCSYLFGGMRILSNELVAAIYGLQLLYLTTTLLRQVTYHNHPLKEETT